MSLVRLCPVTVDCPDRPFGNLSAEEPDPIDWLSFSYQSDPPTPPFGESWTATACGKTFTSTVSQADADLQAIIASILCNLTQENPGRIFVFNQEQQCCVPCGDGTRFCWTVAAGLVPGLNVAQADNFAHNAACLLAKRYRICLSALSATKGCVGSAFSATVTAQGTGLITPATWSIIAGALPDGLELGGFSPNIDVTTSNTETIQGTPTVAGTFTFTLRVTGEDQTRMDKQFTICIDQVSPSTLPNGTVGTAYSQALTHQSCFGATTWSASNLPPGLSINPTTGLISGTPTGSSASYDSIIIATSSAGVCAKHYTITIDSTCAGPDCAAVDGAFLAALVGVYPLMTWNGQLERANGFVFNDGPAGVTVSLQCTVGFAWKFFVLDPAIQYRASGPVEPAPLTGAYTANINTWGLPATVTISAC